MSVRDANRDFQKDFEKKSRSPISYSVTANLFVRLRVCRTSSLWGEVSSAPLNLLKFDLTNMFDNKKSLFESLSGV